MGREGKAGDRRVGKGERGDEGKGKGEGVDALPLQIPGSAPALTHQPPSL